MMQQPAEPSRGASTRLTHDETERLRVSAPPAQPLPVAPQPMQQGFAARPAAKKAPAATQELRKYLLYALIIALGLALHHVFSEMLAKYLSTAYLSETGELVAKLCYPACLGACIWILRTAH